MWYKAFIIPPFRLLFLSGVKMGNKKEWDFGIERRNLKGEASFSFTTKLNALRVKYMR